MTYKFAVVLNAGSGNSQTADKLKLLKEAFMANSSEPEIFLAHGGAAIIECAQKAIGLGYKMIVAAGGDGTVNTVAELALQNDLVLGILPMGTFNHLAKDLKIPLSLDSAIKTLFNGQVVNVDACMVNNKVFINNSSIGLYAKLVRLRQKHQRLGKGKLQAFFAALAGVVWNYSYYKIRLELEGRDITIRSPFVFIGNNKYEIEGLNIGSRQNLKNNELSLYVIRHTSRLNLLTIAFRALFGGIAEHQAFDVYSANKVKIDTKKKSLPVALDGEVITMQTPLEYSIFPGVLKVMAPKEMGDEVFKI